MPDPDVIITSRLIPAPAAAIFELLARPALHPMIDGSGSVKGVQERTPERLSPGARFGMQMKIGVPYKILPRVEEFEEGRLISWRHSGRPHLALPARSGRRQPHHGHRGVRLPAVAVPVDDQADALADAATMRSMQQTLIRMEEWAQSGHPLPGV